MSKILSSDHCAFIGMVHLLPLPGSPRWGGSMEKIIDAALFDVEALVKGGCDVLLVENMNDVPYLRGAVDPETVAAMAIVTARVCASTSLPVGVQVLAGANREALGVALGAGACFIRAEAFAYGHVADEGWMDASAGPLLRARRALGASVEVWADVQKKHAAHALTADLTIGDLSRGAAFCDADALIITGRETGHATATSDIEAARSASLPVVVGSGVNDDNIQSLAKISDGLIVGSWLKQDGDWHAPVDVARVSRLRTLITEAGR